MRAFIVSLLLAAGCGTPPSPTNQVSPTHQPVSTIQPGPPDATEVKDTTAASGDAIVIARITSAGPIGSGRCSQRSYELAVESQRGGEAVPATVWAHFEYCEGDPEPRSAPPAANLSGLRPGSRYELRLRRGSSTNFPDAFMIVEATPAP